MTHHDDTGLIVCMPVAAGEPTAGVALTSVCSRCTTPIWLSIESSLEPHPLICAPCWYTLTLIHGPGHIAVTDEVRARITELGYAEHLDQLIARYNQER